MDMEERTEKTKEELLAANWEDLTVEERSLQSLLENGSEDLTLEEAIEFLNMIP